MVALSMADGYARASGKPQAVIVHVDVGTQALGCAVHNAHIARSPVLIFAGLCPATTHGEEKGSRTEFVNWLQDIPDQSAIVRQYCRYTNEIRSSSNVKEMVNRALQISMSDPKGPVYLYAAREVLEREIKPYKLDQRFWKPTGPSCLPQDVIEQIASSLVNANDPLIITGYSGRNLKTPAELVQLADTIGGLRVLDTSIGDACFPADHPAWLSGRYSTHPSIEAADLILIIDCDVPWVPAKCKVKTDAIIYHVDIDPLKRSFPVFYINAVGRWHADSYTALKQLNTHLNSSGARDSSRLKQAATSRQTTYQSLLKDISLAGAISNGSLPLNANRVAATLKDMCPTNTTWCVEAVTSTFAIYDQLQCTVPGSYISSGATGLGWAGGASLGIKLALNSLGRPSFVVQIIRDGTYMFSMPSSVYWISTRYSIPVLAIVLSNNGWNAPRISLELVHPDGVGAHSSNFDLNISLANPCPDFAGIAKAASNGRIHTGYAETVGDFKDVLVKAIESVQKGIKAVVECRIPGLEGKNKL